MNLSNIFQYSVLLSLALGAERNPSSSGDEGVQPPPAEMSMYAQNRVVGRKLRNSDERIRREREQWELQERIFRHIQMLQNRLAELQQNVAKLESKYERERSRVSGLAGVDKQVAEANLSVLLADLEKSRRDLAAFTKASNRNRDVSSKFQALSVQQQKFSVPASEPYRPGWSDSVPFAYATQVQKELKRISRRIAEFLEFYLNDLNDIREKLKTTKNQEAIKEARYHIELMEEDYANYKICLDNISILFKMIEGTNKATEVLTDVQIENIFKMAEELLVSVEKTNVFNGWQNKIRELREQEQRSSEARMAIEADERRRLQRLRDEQEVLQEELAEELRKSERLRTEQMAKALRERDQKVEAALRVQKEKERIEMEQNELKAKQTKLLQEQRAREVQREEAQREKERQERERKEQEVRNANALREQKEQQEKKLREQKAQQEKAEIEFRQQKEQQEKQLLELKARQEKERIEKERLEKERLESERKKQEAQEAQRKNEEMIRLETQKAKKALKKEQEATNLKMSQAESEWMKKARAAKNEIAGAMKSLLERKAGLEKRRSRQESLYAARLEKFGELMLLDWAKAGAQLSIHRNLINLDNQTLDGINAAIKLHTILESGSKEKLSDREIIKGLSSVASHLISKKEPTTLKDWEREEDKMYPDSLKIARLAKEELQEAIPHVKEAYNYYVGLLKGIEGKSDVQKEKAYTSRINRYKEYLDHIDILNKMIHRTNTADEVLSESQIKSLMDTAGLRLQLKNIPTSLYDWVPVVMEFQRRDEAEKEALRVKEAQAAQQKLEDEEQYVQRQWIDNRVRR